MAECNYSLNARTGTSTLVQYSTLSTVYSMLNNRVYYKISTVKAVQCSFLSFISNLTFKNS